MDFPYKAYKLSPSFQVKEVTVVKKHGFSYPDWVVLDTGSHLHLGDLYETVGDAVKAGLLKLDRQSANAAKTLRSIEKRRSNLSKAKT